MKSTWVIAMFLLASPALADRIDATVSDVTPVFDGQGSARILFRAGPTEAMENVAVRRAFLRLAVAEGGAARRVVLQIHPVTAAWTGGAATWENGAEFDESLYGRREVELGTAGEVIVDVTGVLKEILEHGRAAHGFVLTVDSAEGEGLVAADVERFGQLAGATLEVQYRKTPAIPRARREG